MASSPNRQTANFEELASSNMLTLNALIELLDEKGQRSASRFLAFLAVPTPPGPGDRFQAHLANRLPAFFAEAKFLALNPRQGVLNGAQELAVCLMQP